MCNENVYTWMCLNIKNNLLVNARKMDFETVLTVSKATVSKKKWRIIKKGFSTMSDFTFNVSHLCFAAVS